MDFSSIQLIKNEGEYNQLYRNFRDSQKVSYGSFYDGNINAIITDPALMNIPVDDRLFTRGHGVFDTATIWRGHILQLDFHLERFKNSLQLAQIEISYTTKDLKHIIMQTAHASKLSFGVIRYYLSTGSGSFDIINKNKKPTLYCIVYPLKDTTKNRFFSDPIAEVSISTDVIPLKPPLLSKMKSTNYFLNCLQTETAQKTGGKFGLLVDNLGWVYEGSTCCIVGITQSNELLTPSGINILPSLTLKHVLDIARKYLLSSVPNTPETEYLTSLSMRPVKLDELYKMKECLWVSGGLNLVPIVKLDGNVIGNGDVGYFTKRIAEIMFEEYEHATQNPVN